MNGAPTGAGGDRRMSYRRMTSGTVGTVGASWVGGAPAPVEPVGPTTGFYDASVFDQATFHGPTTGQFDVTAWDVCTWAEQPDIAAKWDCAAFNDGRWG